jgi:hypothetical protein
MNQKAVIITLAAILGAGGAYAGIKIYNLSGQFGSLQQQYLDLNKANEGLLIGFQTLQADHYALLDEYNQLQSDNQELGEANSQLTQAVDALCREYDRLSGDDLPPLVAPLDASFK